MKKVFARALSTAPHLAGLSASPHLAGLSLQHPTWLACVPISCSGVLTIVPCSSHVSFVHWGICRAGQAVHATACLLGLGVQLSRKAENMITTLQIEGVDLMKELDSSLALPT